MVVGRQVGVHMCVLALCTAGCVVSNREALFLFSTVGVSYAPVTLSFELFKCFCV